MTEANEYLCQKRDDLDDERKVAEVKNEELKTQFAAQEEIANKRIQQKLNREKPDKIKQLLAEEEIIKQTNEDYTNKVRTEIENYDTLLRERIEIDE